MSTQFRPVGAQDMASMAMIYNHYIRNTVVTFDEQLVEPETMLARWQSAQEQALPWLVAQNEHEVLGYAYANPWKSKSAYRFVVETSIYLHPKERGRGLGSALYRQLLARLDASDICQAVACISLPNPASLRLHAQLGFHPVGEFSAVGYKFDQWIDVAYWQRACSPGT